MYADCQQLHHRLTRITPERFVFSGGEVQVRWPVATLRGAQAITLYAPIASSNDLMAVMLSVDAFRRNTLHCPPITLVIPYFPYARQDRVCAEGEALSLTVVASMINSLGCVRVVICDPHSDVTPALVNNVQVITQANWMATAKKIYRNKCLRDKVIVAPDQGASKKTAQLAAQENRPFVQATKVRDPKTGAITDTQLHGDVAGKACLIADDICDGGRTFLALSNVLREQGATQVDLLVTHGIFSQGLAPFVGVIDHIFTTDSFPGNHDVPAGLTVHTQPLTLR